MYWYTVPVHRRLFYGLLLQTPYGWYFRRRLLPAMTKEPVTGMTVKEVKDLQIHERETAEAWSGCRLSGEDRNCLQDIASEGD